MLFIDADNDGKISDHREFIFTAWDPTAKGDLEAIARVFDSNGDGKLSGADADFAKFKLERVNGDGTTSILTLAQAGITSINLKADTTTIVLPDGSVITGQTTYTKADGSTGTVANTTLAYDAQGHRVEQAVTVSGGIRTTLTTGYDADGAKAFVMEQKLVIATANSTTRHDDNADGAAAEPGCRRMRQRRALTPQRQFGLDNRRWRA